MVFVLTKYVLKRLVYIVVVFFHRFFPDVLPV